MGPVYRAHDTKLNRDVEPKLLPDSFRATPTGSRDSAARIARGARPLDEALPIVGQIAEALEAAHERGVELRC